MAILFSMSIAVSHYSMGFISFIYLGLLIPLTLVIRSDLFLKIWSWLTSKTGGVPDLYLRERKCNLTLIVLFCTVIPFFIFAFAWYITVSNGINYSLLKGICDSLTASIWHTVAPAVSSTSLSLPTVNTTQNDVYVRAALGLDFQGASLEGKIFRIFQYITQILVVIGCFRLLVKPVNLKFKIEYIALSVTSALILLACFTIPVLAEMLNTSRWYHIALITLAPFCILGGEVVWLWFTKLHSWLQKASVREDNEVIQIASHRFIVMAVLVPYFLFTSGLIYEFTSRVVTDRFDIPYSISLTGYRVDFIGVFTEKDGAAANWLSNPANDNLTVYADNHVSKLLQLSGFEGNCELFPANGNYEPGGLLFFSEWNVKRKLVTFVQINQPGLSFPQRWYDIPGLSQTLANTGIIYSNGGAQIRGPVLPLTPSTTP